MDKGTGSSTFSYLKKYIYVAERNRVVHNVAVNIFAFFFFFVIYLSFLSFRLIKQTTSSAELSLLRRPKILQTHQKISVIPWHSLSPDQPMGG